MFQNNLETLRRKKHGIQLCKRTDFSGGTEIRIGDEGINRITHKSVAFGPVIAIEDIVL